MREFRTNDRAFPLVVTLVVLSIVVGIVLSALGITFDNLFWRLEVFVKRIYDMGWDAVEWAVQYFLLGAIIVVPIWVIARLVGGGGGSLVRHFGGGIWHWRSAVRRMARQLVGA